MNRLPIQTGARIRDNPITCGVGSTRFQSRQARRHSKADPHPGRVDRTRRDQRNGGRGDGGDRRGGRRHSMVYFVVPEPPAPQKFNVKILGMGWTKPSQPVSKHPIVNEVLSTGRISTIFKLKSKIDSFECKPDINGTDEKQDLSRSNPSKVEAVKSLTTVIDEFQVSSDSANPHNDEINGKNEVSSKITLPNFRSSPDAWNKYGHDDTSSIGILDYGKQSTKDPKCRVQADEESSVAQRLHEDQDIRSIMQAEKPEPASFVDWVGNVVDLDEGNCEADENAVSIRMYVQKPEKISGPHYYFQSNILSESEKRDDKVNAVTPESPAVAATCSKGHRITDLNETSGYRWWERIKPKA